MLNKVNLADIRSFVLIAQLGNFTKAAEALSVSRSHVSRQISGLEAQMGVTLLTRTTRTLRLTHAGERFYQECEKALHDIDQALIAAVDDTQEVRGLIRVNCVGGYIGEDIVAKYVNEFMLEYPDVFVDLDFSSPRIDLIEDQFDVAIRMGELEDAGFVARKLMMIDMVTLASPRYLKIHGEPVAPKELAKHRTLTGSVTRWSYRNVATPTEHSDVIVKGNLRCKNGRALVMGALYGNGIIRVPLSYCDKEVEQGKLVKVMPEWEIPSVPLSAIFHRDRYQPKRLRTFIDFIKAKFEQDAKA
ncbi:MULTISPECIES: LysR family transcriptional regulator [Vibrio]|jgi:DNA-binding transcriptional LysR family regulator|uniref:Bacterial regulatory helix-turn-helix, lysR family protein n=1 Tax=Vibrio harveyi TaxID=669 RepID=A0A454CNS5_VIBHA|nr:MULTISPECIES: LysR family transcriptional regulator [Vibrio]AIV06109.1 LysR family transcriptional regulator [Vibrio harveyi]AMF96894.1 LysR family transcriptional regulator [Vibrio harveyi]EKM13826.1 bacterial regulatory helix-turn-helix, lysR family protein [Vibrio harveyi]EKM28057.1 bacterial regulatory helix-turn-helix, lysR family protein [Vibrio harveyi]EKO3799991.1 LysR family transcriptional regulator [Vibrio harveyi]